MITNNKILFRMLFFGVNTVAFVSVFTIPSYFGPILIGSFIITFLRFALNRGHADDKAKYEAEKKAISAGAPPSLTYRTYQLVDISLLLFWLYLGPGMALALMILLMGSIGSSDGEVCIPRGPCY